MLNLMHHAFFPIFYRKVSNLNIMIETSFIKELKCIGHIEICFTRTNIDVIHKGRIILLSMRTRQKQMPLSIRQCHCFNNVWTQLERWMAPNEFFHKHIESKEVRNITNIYKVLHAIF